MTTPSTPPTTAERLLEALGATPKLRDAVLGDLAEEYAIRAARDGEGAARRWYWGQTIHATPHLLRDWARGLRPLYAARIAGIAGATILILGAVVFGVLLAVEVGVERIAGPTVLPWHDPEPGTLSLGGMLLGYIVVASTTGWLASRLEQRAPAVAVIVLSIAWVIVAFIAPLPARAPLPAWYLLGQAVAVAVGSALGGMREIGMRRPTSADR